MSNHDGGGNPANGPTHYKHEVAKNFDPLRSGDSNLWRPALQKLRERFEAAVRDGNRLTCVVRQSIIPEWPARTELPNLPGLAGWEPVAFGGGPRREPRQLFTKRENGEETIVVSDVGRLLQKGHQPRIPDKSKRIRNDDAEYEPLVGDRPVYDIGGKPIVFSDGEPVAMRLGAFRTYTIYGLGSAKDRAATCRSFYANAAEAGRSLHGLPAELNRILWRDWLDGFMEIDDPEFWVNALFELAWQRLPGSPLVAEKLAWQGQTSIPLDSLPHVDSLPHFREQVDKMGIPDPAAHWYSVLDNLLSASVAAIDALLAIGESVAVEQPVNPKIEPTKPTGKPATNQQAIEDLERQTPKLDTKSVEWLAAGKKNEKKLGLPLATLRNYRAASKGGRKMPDKMFGIDRHGRLWRREGTETSMLYYYVPSLPKR